MNTELKLFDGKHCETTAIGAVLANQKISQAQHLFSQSAVLWTEVANLCEAVSGGAEQILLDEIINRLNGIVDLEFEAMQLLSQLEDE